MLSRSDRAEKGQINPARAEQVRTAAEKKCILGNASRRADRKCMERMQMGRSHAAVTKATGHCVSKAGTDGISFDSMTWYQLRLSETDRTQSCLYPVESTLDY